MAGRFVYNERDGYDLLLGLAQPLGEPAGGLAQPAP